mmetsp:Transcript_5239/g.9981  ORF Transcript_5239/g.9981 Transcript_5239/m.9981 type:complete len:668 (-) Transcript_5239:175-2178(-)
MRVATPVELDTKDQLLASSGCSPWSPASPPPSLQLEASPGWTRDGPSPRAPAGSTAATVSKSASSRLPRTSSRRPHPPRLSHRLSAPALSSTTELRRPARASHESAPPETLQKPPPESELLRLGACRSPTTPEPRLSGPKVVAPSGAEVGGLASWSEADPGEACGPWDKSPLVRDDMLRAAERASKPASLASDTNPESSPCPSPRSKSTSGLLRRSSSKAAGGCTSPRRSCPRAPASNLNQNHNHSHHHHAGVVSKLEDSRRPGRIEAALSSTRTLSPSPPRARNETCAASSPAASHSPDAAEGMGSRDWLGETTGARVTHDPFPCVDAPCSSLPDVFGAHTRPGAQSFYRQMRQMQRRRSNDSASCKTSEEWACRNAGMCARGRSPSPGGDAHHQPAPASRGGLERAFRRDVGASPEPTRRAGGRATSQSPPSGGVRAGCIGNPLAHPAEAQDHLLLKHSTLRRSNLLGETSQSPSNIMHSPDRRPIGGGGGATRTRAFQLGVAASDLFGRRLSRTDHSVACHDLDKHNTMRDTWSGLPRSEKFKEGLKQEESGPLTYADGNTNLLRNAYTGFVLAAGAIPKNVVQGGRKQGQSRAMENIGGGGICSRRPCEDAHIPDAIDDMLLLQHERVGDSDHTRRQRRRQILSARNANGIQNAGLRNKYRQL